MPKYVLPDLRYDYGALEPHISGKIMADRFEAARTVDMELAGVVE